MRKEFVAALFAIGGFFCCTNAVSNEPNSLVTHPPAKVFERALADIKGIKTVPVLLPSKLPRPLVEKDIHFSGGTASKDKYEIYLEYEEGMGNAGFAGYFKGDARGYLSSAGKKVRLEGGIKGYFSAKSCGGSCSPSMITWRQGKVVYTLQLKLAVASKHEEEVALVKAANSSIRGGSR
jgi:hypothetical protein